MFRIFEELKTFYTCNCKFNESNVVIYENSSNVAHACRRRRLKWVLRVRGCSQYLLGGVGVAGYTWGLIMLGVWFCMFGVGRRANNPTP
ncbi:hypothetical protein TNCV_997281 [Trichonephila clavipes]|uniref:Transmembrane protein n=1 Tax=Trichonephila clavipes TaxID=2585209 RepID=A0A8X6WGC5_TRICX|nr:hypothetical protein TNCV_997281 [Trichonephila clavipes]